MSLKGLNHVFCVRVTHKILYSNIKSNHMDESTSALLLLRIRYLSESLADSAGVTARSPQNHPRDYRESLA